MISNKLVGKSAHRRGEQRRQARWSGAGEDGDPLTDKIHENHGTQGRGVASWLTSYNEDERKRFALISNEFGLSVSA